MLLWNVLIESGIGLFLLQFYLLFCVVIIGFIGIAGLVRILYEILKGME